MRRTEVGFWKTRGECPFSQLTLHPWPTVHINPEWRVKKDLWMLKSEASLSNEKLHWLKEMHYSGCVMGHHCWRWGGPISEWTLKEWPLMKQTFLMWETHQCLQEGAWWLHSDGQMLCRDKDRKTKISDEKSCPKNQPAIIKDLNIRLGSTTL